MTDEQEMDQGNIRISISSEPTDEEAAAIVAAVNALASSRRGQDVACELREDAWRIAGRHEALRASEWFIRRPGNGGR